MLVVLHHAALYALQLDLANPLWRPLTEILRSMRMPLFFAAAGLFAGKWAIAGWRDVFRTKVLLLTWVYLVWVVIRWVWYNLDPNQTVEDGLSTLFLRLVWPTGGWFIYTLALFFILLKLTRRAPAWLQLAIAGVASVLSLAGVVTIGNHAWDGVLSFYAFFLIGVHGRAVLIPLVDRIPLWAALSAPPAIFAAVAALKYFHFADFAGVEFAIRVIGLIAGLCLARIFSGWALLRHLGQSTLPIYMLHSLLIASTVTLIDFVAPFPEPVGLVTPVAIAAVALTASYWAGRGAARTRYLAWLYDVPGWLRKTSSGTAPAAVLGKHQSSRTRS